MAHKSFVVWNDPNFIPPVSSGHFSPISSASITQAWSAMPAPFCIGANAGPSSWDPCLPHIFTSPITSHRVGDKHATSLGWGIWVIRRTLSEIYFNEWCMCGNTQLIFSYFLVFHMGSQSFGIIYWMAIPSPYAGHFSHILNSDWHLSVYLCFLFSFSELLCLVLYITAWCYGLFSFIINLCVW